MFNTDVADMKQASEILSKKGETLATRGKLVDEMFDSATTYLQDYAGRTGDHNPAIMWFGYRESWRKNVTDSVSFAQTMDTAYQRYDALFKEAKDVTTIEEMQHAIASLKDLTRSTPPEIPPDYANRFVDIARNVSEFASTHKFPELDRHYEFINDSLRQFAVTWSDLCSESFKLRELIENIIDASVPVIFKAYIRSAIEVVVPLPEGLERYMSSLKLEE